MNRRSFFKRLAGAVAAIPFLGGKAEANPEIPKEIECGQIWKSNKEPDIYCLPENAYMIVLGKDKEFWRVAAFWKQNFLECWGGAAQLDLVDEEITRNAKYITNMEELFKE